MANVPLQRPILRGVNLGGPLRLDVQPTSLVQRRCNINSQMVALVLTLHGILVWLSRAEWMHGDNTIALDAIFAPSELERRVCVCVSD